MSASNGNGHAVRPTHEHKHSCEKCGTNSWYREPDEYDSLANGGSYEVCSCVHCEHRVYSMLPD